MHEARMGDKRNLFRSLVVNTERKIQTANCTDQCRT